MRRRPSWRTVAGAVMVTALVAGTAWQAWIGLRQNIDLMPGPLDAARDVVVPRGDTARVAEALAAAGVIRHPWEFRLAAALTRDQGALHAGEFAFPAHVTVGEVLAILRTARPVAHRLTLPEGLTARQITHLFDTADAAAGHTPAIAEGSVLPQTYLYPRGTTRAALVERAHAALDAALAAAWAKRVPDSALRTPR
ncbi:endolytic transglycosylase MltG, partial [Acidisphaera rubrifaciens]|uniref:endolytic transglycosylase MltG n=1 Tax=Acidisphaera rubrifaciens TaxID=50715 RepID=UPI00066292B7